MCGKSAEHHQVARKSAQQKTLTIPPQISMFRICLAQVHQRQEVMVLFLLLQAVTKESFCVVMARGRMQVAQMAMHQQMPQKPLLRMMTRCRFMTLQRVASETALGRISRQS